MAIKKTSQTSLELTPSSSVPAKDAGEPTLDDFLESREGEKLAAWVQQQYSQCRSARQSKQIQWEENLAMFYGKHRVVRAASSLPNGYRDKLIVPNSPYYKKQKTINRVRAFARAEHSKFLSSIPAALVVPSTAEDQDVRAAYAGEQAWKSISETQNLRNQYARAAWWMIITGNGFIKTSWDQSLEDKASGEQGAIRFASITPFNLFIPDLREVDIEDQPYVINAYVKTVEWCKTYFKDQLNGRTLSASVASANSIVEEGHMNLASAGAKPDSCVVYETWVKPGATELLPNGGLVISIDSMLLVAHKDGIPYDHGQYPFTKFEHIPTSTFYADSPLNDINALNKEYNELRTDISEAGRRMGRPQLLVAKGSLVTSKLTNEAGLVIEYRPGLPAPVPLQLAPLPQYFIEQQDRVLSDIEDLTGQHEVSRGQAPAGVTAGTAINYLQEKDDQYLTPQYQSIEDGYGKLGGQAISLFVQYVDMARKIKVIGADGAFDTLMLNGSDLKNATDVRIERGSAIGQSKAASDARVMDMFSMGLIDQNTALRLVELGGSQKVLDLMNVAERKAQRENTKMKLLTQQLIDQHEMEYEQQVQQFQMMPPAPVVEGEVPQGPPPISPIVKVDDFDVHEIHIDTHNKFRMSQEYEVLPDDIKAQFDLHVQEHESMKMEQLMQQMMQGSMGMGMGEGAGQDASPAAAPGGGGQGPQDPIAGMMAGNGAVPASPQSEGGAPIG